METTRDLYRFQIKVPAGKSVSFDVVEDQNRLDALAMESGACVLQANGIHVKAVNSGNLRPAGTQPLTLRIDKGLLFATYKNSATWSYFVQNNSEIDRSFKDRAPDRQGAGVRHRDKDEKAEKAEPQKGPGIYSFVLKVPKGQTGQRHISLEQTCEETGVLLQTLSEGDLRTYLTTATATAEVKAMLSKLLAMNAKIAETQKRLDQQQQQLKQLSDDQARLRENLKIIPQTSEPYKKFLDKFVAQESEIEAFQREVRLWQAALQERQQEVNALFGVPAPSALPVSLPQPTPPPSAPYAPQVPPAAPVAPQVLPTPVGPTPPKPQ